ncbi:Hypothetical predicted protein [Marmota monax]|uniref:Uncharacterized protein n=1 Tax=Marmota monax TaxID=9995 RepID=A0A5E4D7Z0_MARMO|nr:Hypothetical predicted protein [Marmota monax]
MFPFWEASPVKVVESRVEKRAWKEGSPTLTPVNMETLCSPAGSRGPASNTHLGKAVLSSRHLKTPLKTLSITNCPLSDSDWNHLSRCPNTRQLRHLELTDFSPESLKILLESTVASLKSLDLEACGITDSQLQALLPALSHCSQLRVLSFHGNRISMSALRDLLLHTARLSQLSIELYPAPLESYDAQDAIHPGRCSQLCAELTAIMRDFMQPNVLVFCTVPCCCCGYKFMYKQGLIHCSCPTAA